MKGMIIGRFQPFHNGHLALIKKASDECTDLVIAIGSPHAHDERNPFSLDERKDMLKHVLETRGIQATIFAIEDIPEDNEWEEHVRIAAGDFDKVYSGDAADLSLFSRHTKVSIGRIDGISATEIRKLLRTGDEKWKELVPVEIHGLIARKNFSSS